MVRRNISPRRRVSLPDLRSREELVAVQIAALGKHRRIARSGQRGLAAFPLSDFLREEIGAPDLDQLQMTPNRVLDVSSQYIRLGMYGHALNVLSRRYPPVIADQSEPQPAGHPLVGLFRGYCSRIGTIGLQRRIETIHRIYFPSTAEGAQKQRHGPVFATPPRRFLLGNLYFSHAETDSALGEWAEARKSGPCFLCSMRTSPWPFST